MGSLQRMIVNHIDTITDLDHLEGVFSFYIKTPSFKYVHLSFKNNVLFCKCVSKMTFQSKYEKSQKEHLQVSFIDIIKPKLLKMILKDG